MSGNRMTILVKKSQDRYYQKYYTLFISSVIHSAHICNYFRIMLLFLYILSVLICHISSHQLFELCLNSKCVWQGGGLYDGCLPDHVHVTTLTCPLLRQGDVLDLRCTSVKIIFIENSPMSCGESLMLGGTKGAVLYMNGKQSTCSVHLQTGGTTILTRAIINKLYQMC